MGELSTNLHWRSEPTDGPSQYSRMIPGVSVVTPARKAATSREHAASAVRGKSSGVGQRRTLVQNLLPHLIAESLPRYKAVGADLIVLVVVCGTQTLLFPAWGLRAIALPLFAVLVTLFAFSEGVYSPNADPFPERFVPGLARSVLFAVALVFFAERDETSPLAILVTFVSSLAALQLYRGARRFVWARGNHENDSRNVLMVGGGPVARSIARTLCNDPLHRASVRVRGSVDDDLPLSATVLGRIADLDWLARSEFIDEVIIALPGRPDLAREAVEAAFRNHLDIRAVPNLPPGNWPEAGVDFIGDVPVVTLHHEHVPSVGLFVKRVIDVMGAIVALALASPVMVLVALLIRLDSRGPIIYGAERTGAKGRRFRCYKFRSMVSNADHLKANLLTQNQRQGPIFKIVGDPRITRIGHFIRRYSLDELPQLWNVLIGDMSMVGPRPHPVDEVNRYELHHYRRLDMKPGITGLWQITARHSPSFELNMHLDLTYIENWTLRLDLRILLGTVRVLFMPEGA
jgi:exopolysaccharide biosynthesis polyprenyl glycosylphosphotransferase